MSGSGGMSRRLRLVEERMRRRGAGPDWQDWLEGLFAGAEFASHRQALMDALAGEHPSWAFEVERDVEREVEGDGEGAATEVTRYAVWWWDREAGAPPIVMALTRVEAIRGAAMR